jgi:H+/Cl- antiporter ClcA
MKKAILSALAAQAGSATVFAIACFTKWSVDFASWPTEDRWLTAFLAAAAGIFGSFSTWAVIEFREKYPHG